MDQIKNIIFDLGGVLLNIDYNKTSESFKKLGIVNFDEMYSQAAADHLFEDLETGRISDAVFIETILKKTHPTATAENIREAWNAMLLNFRTGSLEALEQLAKKYHIFLLSNTNNIHLQRFREIFIKETGKSSLETFFVKAYYSNIVGLRKPYREIYDYVLADAGIEAADTLFIDDSIQNISGAIEAGLKTHFLKPGQCIEELNL